MVRTTLYKAAFTMIELIFAIVIIAIAVLSLPMITRVTSEAIDDNLVQEAIFAGAAELMSASAGYWDENSMQDINISFISRVIDISGDCNLTTNLRPGHIAQPLHRRCLDNPATPANDAAGGLVIDLNDAAKNGNLYTNVTTNAAGYKETYNSVITVTTIGNVKTITSTISNLDGIPIVVLNIQSANIGEIDYYKRRF
ncbi:MAG: prepilin-type N-terminal cleavage/methylation domain-containing protein [Sulfurimonas sp.]|nr:prepilin-type N-terminal cleavage/methylation domain-containing protein [Sulfurimonas sp.]